MTTTRKTKKTTAKRQLTDAELKRMRHNFQSFMPFVAKLKENEKIDSESRATLRKIHKCLQDALSYSQRLNH